jgi:hypothetical protein
MNNNNITGMYKGQMQNLFLKSSMNGIFFTDGSTYFSDANQKIYVNDSNNHIVYSNSKGDHKFYGDISSYNLTTNWNKDFVISHPVKTYDSDDKTDYQLRHGSYEGPASGGLIYRDIVEVTNGTATPEFPDYILDDEFGADWTPIVVPTNHYGSGYLDTTDWTVNADTDGEYVVVLMGQRTDDNALNGRGGITTKRKDETWDNAADRYYGGAEDVKPTETANPLSDIDDQALIAHAQKDDKTYNENTETSTEEKDEKVFKQRDENRNQP